MKESVLKPVFDKLDLWGVFIEFMQHQTVQLLDDGEVFYYTRDIHNFLSQHYAGVELFWD